MTDTYIMGFSLYDLLWFFFIYSVFGWMIETLYESYKQGLLVNRGFLIGCYCPIYGFGSWLVLFSLHGFRGKPLLLFALGVVLTTALEYFVGWLMETVFRSKWWDYSDSKFNVKGRISLFTSAVWGLLCVIVVEYIHPLVVRLIHSFNYAAGIISLTVVFGVVACDAVISFIAAVRLANKMSRLAGIKEKAVAFVLQFAPIEEVEGLRQSFLSSRIGEIISSGYDRLKAAAASTIQASGLQSALDSLHELYDQAMSNISLNERRFFRAFPTLYFPKLRELSDEVRERASREDTQTKSGGKN